MPWLDIYEVSLTTSQLAHLLRRAISGPQLGFEAQYRGQTAAQVVDLLMAPVEPPPPPTDATGKTFHDLSFGAPETTQDTRNNLNNQQRQLLKQWWIGLMAQPAHRFREKMVLFWQNHFVVASQDVNDVRFMYRYNDLLRKHALGNFRTFVLEITQDPAMLWYLNGNENVVGRPNENYARELMELFTIGLGNYAEEDVKAAARVLTGWQAVGYRNANTPTVGVNFRFNQHDSDNKQFSAHFQNKVIKSDVGLAELEALVDMILQQPETARFIVRKLYRWFVAAEISKEIEENFIEPLAAEFRQDYEVAPVVKKLLRSEHFFAESQIGAQIKSPLDLAIGTLLGLGLAAPSPISNRSGYDGFTNYILGLTRPLEMEVMEQATVFGWRPYYDTGLYKLWISGTSLGLRGQFTDQVIQGLPLRGIYTDLIHVAGSVSEPSDPVVLIRELWGWFIAVPLSDEILTRLVDDVFLEGIPRYEWTGIWNAYQAGKDNQSRFLAVHTRLMALFMYLFRLAEYQLC
ncbi:DUF1800 domain-containing protein [Telluribacter sp.]|jgi:uncharacterized protein (DUF1800 family)|uniref:DUF1800 domain-containing protein n=1 Tax=Telluribacter sp. TaxID=1978767 RepID=UPI002E10E326|nr:DUF1800 domain-containing protein [Telluribacter sp.]